MLVACIEVEENQAPTISFLTPVNNSIFLKGETVTFSVTVNDPENGMREVRFFANDIGLGSDDSWPYEYTWATESLDEGEYSIKAEAIDNEGEKGASTIDVSIGSAPFASFFVLPNTGTIATAFSFDASDCNDLHDDVSELQVRWDWENDSIWDTAYSAEKVIEHEYDSIGIYNVSMEVIDSDGFVDVQTEQLIILENTPPIAAFTVNPLTGTTATIFAFDANASLDDEEESNDLQIRWDWEDDNIWDTETSGITNYTTIKLASHQFSIPGNYFVTMEVLDNGGLKDTLQKSIHVLGIVTDIDGNAYNTIMIGDQEWMVENLKVTRYRNGDNIATGHSDSNWTQLSTGAYAIYNDNTSNEVETYGVLYNWAAIENISNIAPVGWHVPTDAEWRLLVNNLGGVSIAGGKLKETGTDHWNSPNAGATNESGFTALPGGTRIATGNYSGINLDGYFWSSTEQGENYAWYRNLISQQGLVTVDYVDKRYGFSVRCVKD